MSCSGLRPDTMITLPSVSGAAAEHREGKQGCLASIIEPKLILECDWHEMLLSGLVAAGPQKRKRSSCFILTELSSISWSGRYFLLWN